MQKKKPKKNQVKRRNIYVKPVDFELFEWAENQRQSLSEIIAKSTIDRIIAYAERTKN